LGKLRPNLGKHNPERPLSTPWKKDRFFSFHCANPFQAWGALMGKYFYRLRLIFFLAGFTSLIVGCNMIPVPEEKKAYVGTWEGVGFHLTIHEDGGIDYRRVKGKSTTTVTGPLQDFIGDDFVVGVLFVTTTFEVQHPPYLDGDDWFMVVDGVELKKVAGPII